MSENFRERIEKAYPKMSKGQKKIALFLAEQSGKAAFLTANSLGQQVGVSESTVVRFADTLGYAGYPELQRELQEMLRSRLTGEERLARTGEIGTAELMEKVLKTDIENIRTTMNEIDRDSFEQTVNCLLAAKNIYIMGVRSAETIAHLLGYYLNFILNNVHTVMDTANDNIEQLIHLTPDDVFLGISFPRYSKRTVDAMAYAHQHGARCIALTDSAFSPLCELADVKLEVCCDTASFVDSLVAPLSVINALLAVLSQKKKDDLSKNLKEMESIWNQNHFYAGK